jgi:hypothetical protein
MCCLNGKRPCQLISLSMSPAYVFRAANMAENADAVRFVPSARKSSPWRPDSNLQSEFRLCTVTSPSNRNHSLNCEITLFRGTSRLDAARHLHPLVVLQTGLVWPLDEQALGDDSPRPSAEQRIQPPSDSHLHLKKYARNSRPCQRRRYAGASSPTSDR